MSAWNAGDLGLIPGSGRSPGEGNGKPTAVLLPGESHGGRSLVGYSSWGHKELDTTKRLHFLLSFLGSISLVDHIYIFAIMATLFQCHGEKINLKFILKI